MYLPPKQIAIEGLHSVFFLSRFLQQLANLGHFVLLLKVRDFYVRKLCVWVVWSDMGWGSDFVRIFQCADHYRDLKADFSFGLALDFVGCVAVLPHEIMSTVFFGAGGGELGDSCSISLPLLFVGTLGFWWDFGVTGSSSSSLASSLVFLFSF